MWQKILVVSLVLVMALSFTACAKKVEKEVALPSAQEIVNGVIASLDDIRTSQFDMDMTMDMAGEAEGEVFEVTMVMDSSGALDLESRQMMMDMTMNMVVPGGDEIDIGMEMYLVNDMVYMLMEIPVMGPMWIKSEMPQGYWSDVNQTESQIELLKTAQVEVIGSEIIGGVDCYVLQVIPDAEQLWQIAMQQAKLTGQAVIPEITEEFIKEMFRSFSVKQWVAKDNYFLAKAEMDMALELTPEAMGFPEEDGGITMDISIILLAHSYNQPVSIVLPPGAEEAMEMPIQ